MRSIDINSDREDVIVVFTGYMFGAWTFRDMVSEIADHRVIVFEDIGSADESYEGGSLIGAIGAVVQELDCKSITKIHLVGHSMGGFVAQAVCLAFPDRIKSLALLGSCHVDQFRQSYRIDALPVLDALFDMKLDSFINMVTKSVFSDIYFDRGEEGRKLKDDIRANLPDRERCRDQLNMLQQLYRDERVASHLDVPCLAIFADHDKIVPESWVRQLSEHCRLPPEFRAIDSSHMFMYEQPKLTSQILIDWVDRQR